MSREGPNEMNANWGEPDPPPVSSDDRYGSGERPWVSPGPPPGHQPRQRRKMSYGMRWALVGAVATVVLCAIGTLIGALAADSNPRAPGPVAPPARVEVTGDCEKRIVGEYALSASVGVRNATDKPVRGMAWVRWSITGQDPYSFSEDMHLAPGATGEFHLDEPINGQLWFRLGKCEYGWEPA